MYIVLQIVVRQVEVRQRGQVARGVVEHDGKVQHALAGEAALRQREVPQPLWVVAEARQDAYCTWLPVIVALCTIFI